MKPWATARSSASKKAHEKSARVLMFVEYALRRSVSTISSVAATSAFRITSNVIGSSGALRAHARFPAPHTELNVRPSEKRAPERLEMSIGGSCPAITAASDSPIAGPILNPWPLPPKQE